MCMYNKQARSEPAAEDQEDSGKIDKQKTKQLFWFCNFRIIDSLSSIKTYSSNFSSSFQAVYTFFDTKITRKSYQNEFGEFCEICDNGDNGNRDGCGICANFDK